MNGGKTCILKRVSTIDAKRGCFLPINVRETAAHRETFEKPPFIVDAPILQPSTSVVAKAFLDIEQPFLSIKTAGVTRKGAISAHHTMARNDDRNRVSTHSTAHRARARGTFIARSEASTTNLIGNPAIRHRGTARNTLQHAPYLKLKWCTYQMKRRRIRRCTPGKEGVEPGPGVIEHGRCRAQAVRYALAIECRAIVRLTFKPKAGKPARIGSKGNHAERRSIRLGNHVLPLCAALPRVFIRSLV